MWHALSASTDAKHTQKFRILSGDAPVAYNDVVALWQDSEQFRDFFIALLANSPFAAFRWETPLITSQNSVRDFEFVLLNSRELDRDPDVQAFASQFSDTDQIVTFPNLGGDAVLVVPCPLTAKGTYSHLAAFLRRAPRPQVHELWQCVGAAMQGRISDAPVWLNTAGMGVSWLHVRLDAHPKYYGYLPYKNPPSGGEG